MKKICEICGSHYEYVRSNDYFVCSQFCDGRRTERVLAKGANDQVYETLRTLTVDNDARAKQIAQLQNKNRKLVRAIANKIARIAELQRIAGIHECENATLKTERDAAIQSTLEKCHSETRLQARIAELEELLKSKGD